MTTTPILQIEEVDDTQAGAAETHNASIYALEALAAGQVISRQESTPPIAPDGSVYIVGPSATDSWAGQDGSVAYIVGGVWEFLPAIEGMVFRIQNEDLLVVYNGAEWVAIDGQQTLTDAATIAWNAKWGTGAQVTLGGNRTMGAPTNVEAGRTLTLVVTQDATGSRTISWDSAFRFPGGTAPSLTATGDAVDVLRFYAQTSSVLLYLGGQFNLS